MNIWLCFVPGSAASSIEMILRSGCVDLDTLPIQGGYWQPHDDFVIATGKDKQWHPTNKSELFNPKYKEAKDNVFTPIVPMADMNGNKILKHINKQDGIKYYIGPKDNRSAEFALFAHQKTPIHVKSFTHDIESYDIWEKRELLSLSLMQWWLPQMQENWKLAELLGFKCIDTYDIFAYYKRIVEDLISNIGCNIIDRKLFYNLTEHWFNGQGKVWDDWNNYNEYKQGRLSKITGSIIHEAMIQHHLREQGIELKCYGLNEFPDSQTLKEYYE